MKLFKEDVKHDYRIYQSNLIIDNKHQFINEINSATKHFRHEFPEKDLTWTYGYYNTFCLTSPSLLFHNLFIELKQVIREYVGHDRPLWMQSWINYHMPNQLLPWHDHLFSFHGYISIEPHLSRTVFEEYEIKNEVGNIYVGPGWRKHTVIADENYHTPRITLGYDVLENPHQPTAVFSLIPI
jgi:hypothetical protein